MAASNFKEVSGKQAFDIVLPDLKAAVLQRIKHLHEPASVAGTPTQLLTSANIRISDLRVHVVDITQIPKDQAQSVPSPKKQALECDVRVGRIGFHLHTTTSHPRSKVFVPTTLLYALIRPFRATLKSSTDAVSATLDFGLCEGTLDGQAPRVIAITFQSAIRFVSKIATTVEQSAVARSQNRRRLVHAVLKHHQDRTIWTDPLSWTQASFIVKTGLPAKLRSDISWKIIAHLRHRLRDMDGQALQQLHREVEAPEAPPTVDQISTLLAAQQWTDITHDADESIPTPLLLDILYPPSPIDQALETVRRSGAFALSLRQVEFSIRGEGLADNILAVGPTRSRVEVGRKRLESMRPNSLFREEEEGLFIFASLSVDSCAARIQPSLIPFLSEVLRVQRRAARPKQNPISTTPTPIDLTPIVVEVALTVADAQLEAFASKVILNIRSTGVTVSGNLTYRAAMSEAQYSGCGLSAVTDEFRVSTRATAVGSRHAADQDILAEMVFVHSTLSVLGKEAVTERHLHVLLGQQDFLINVPRSALKLYHFVREWKAEYLS